MLLIFLGSNFFYIHVIKIICQRKEKTRERWIFSTLPQDDHLRERLGLFPERIFGLIWFLIKSKKLSSR